VAERLHALFAEYPLGGGNARGVDQAVETPERGGGFVYRAFDVSNPGDLRVGDRVRVDNGQISRI